MRWQTGEQACRGWFLLFLFPSYYEGHRLRCHNQRV